MSLSDDQPHTRTRLPVSDLPTPPPGSRPRPLRTLLTVLAIVVLLVVTISIANRDKATPSTTTGGTQTVGQASGPPTAATGQQPVQTSTGGVPTGYPHTDQGAQSAAANYAVALGSAGMFNAATRHSVIAAITDPAVTDALQRRLDSGFTAAAGTYGLNAQGEAPAGLTFISRAIPVGTRTDAYNADTARIAVWSNGLTGLAGQGSTQPVAENWFTLTMDLHWAGNDWKLTDYSRQAGPAPITGDQPAATADEIKSAVEQYGGFRYAR